MKKIRNALFILICFLFLSVSFSAFGEEIESEKSGLDVTFVMDYSGSMAANDPDRTAIGMVKAFIDTVYSADIRIGFVAYNDHILSSSAPVSVRTTEERESLKGLMDSVGYQGNTDIGLGLNYAYGLTGQETGRKRVMVLISDGETDLKGSSTGRTKESSDQDLKNVLNTFRSEEVAVYTVAFGRYEGNSQVLKEISGGTGGENYTVERPETLIEVLYGIFHDNMAYQIQEIANGIYGEGSQSLRLKLEDSYIDEMAILMISPQQVGDTTVFYGEQQIKPVNLTHYSVAKVWDVEKDIKEMTIQTSTARNQELKIYLISYRNLIPVLEIESSAARNQTFPYRIYFKDESGAVIADEAFYKNFTPKIEIYGEGQSEKGRRELEISIQNGILEGEIAIPRSGTYYIESRLDDVMESCVFDTARIQIINTPPAGGLPGSIHYNPLTKEKQFVLDEYFTDSDGDSLSYELDQSFNDLAEVSLNQGILSIKPLRSGDESLILKISDGEAAASYTYSISVVPLWKAYWWVLVLAAAVFGAILWKILYKPKPELEVITEEKANNRFQGKMDGYFMCQPENEEEIPPLTFPLYKIRDNRVSIGDLMKNYPEASDSMGLDRIYLIADENRKMILYHSSDSVIMLGSSILCKNLRYSVCFGDIISVTSPDGAYDLEIHYISMIQ
ncbi:VWA domain-containing protein [Lacrimispora sp.]|uniref:vWA domain-containing protein n=1 Tax=Lacrimispora sp. TaxID=2719234 RepID=UPI00345F205E